MATTRRRSVLVAHPSAELYGSDRVMLETVSALTARGERVVVVTPTDGPLLAEARRRGATAEIVGFPVLRKRLLSASGLARLAVALPTAIVRAIRMIRLHRVDAVYVSTLTIPVWLVAARLSGRVAVCHVHEAEAAARPIMKRALSTPLLLAQAIATNSEFSAGVLAEPYPALGARTTVVLNAVDGPPAPTPPRGTLSGSVRLAYVGRLSERKGVDLCVAAVKLLADRGRDATLDIVGDVFDGYEWFAVQLRQYVADNGLEERVRFLGFRPSVWEELDAADIALVPSRLDEPFGNTAVEAVLARRPVVVSETSGLREAAAGYPSAVFVRPGDAEAIADAVERIADDWDTFRRDAETARDDAAERHSRARYDDAILAVIDRADPHDGGHF
ncbi:glycosyltransferase family 4 protein [Microbacterium sp. X-17]|uniref:glycosyltransferase family 4 protein n=1 Tax=Microbacterium sp. X-17 TaxID=3144404 RepID=UPI0031F589D5